MTVYVVDDDDGMRASMEYMLTRADYHVETFASGAEFLATSLTTRRSCLIVNVNVGDMSAEALRQALVAHGLAIPMLVLSHDDEVPEIVQALRTGELVYISTPFQEETLLERIKRALDRDSLRASDQPEVDAMRQRLDQLTTRERQVLDGVLSGRVNRVIATILGVSQKTVEFHRRNVMEKLEVESVAELVRLVMLVDSNRLRPPTTDSSGEEGEPSPG